MAGNGALWTVLGVVVVVLLILIANWMWQDRSIKIYNGFWQYGLMTNPGSGCTGTPKTCDPDSTFKAYAPFYYTALAVGSVDPAYNDSTGSGSQQGLVVGNQKSNYLIAPLDGQGDSTYYQWRFKNSYWNSIGTLFRFASPEYQLYNEGLGQYLVPVIGDFPQGSVTNWSPNNTSNTVADPPGWLAHNFYAAPPTPDYKTVFPYYWKMGQYFVPNSAGAPEGQDPDNNTQVTGITCIVACVWFPKTAGAKSGDGTWLEYFMEVGAGTSGAMYQLGGPVNLNLGSGGVNERMNTRFMAGYYMNANAPVNATTYITSLAGGAKTSSCNNGKQSGSTCQCSGGAFGFNCLYPSPSALTISSLSPPHKYSSSSATAMAPQSTMMMGNRAPTSSWGDDYY